MPLAEVNGIEIAYEVHGDPADPPLLLINGLGSQLVRWPAGWIDADAVAARIARATTLRP